MHHTTAQLLNDNFLFITGAIFYGCLKIIGISQLQRNFILTVEGGDKIEVHSSQRIIIFNDTRVPQ